MDSGAESPPAGPGAVDASAPVRSADYGPLAAVYPLLTWLLTGGGALRTQRHLLRHVRPGDRVLHAGCGPGAFNVDLARSGAEITYVDIAPAMIARARARVEAAVGTAHAHQFIAADLTRLPPAPPYDVVIAAYFLNTFAWPEACRVLALLCDQVAPGGTLCIADECRSQNALLAWILDAGRRPTLGFYRLFTQQPIHPLYDYDPERAARGWQILDRARDRRDYRQASAWQRQVT